MMKNLTLGLIFLISITPNSYAGRYDVDQQVQDAKTSTALTDQEQRGSRTYIDQTKANEVIKEACGNYGCNPALVDKNTNVFDPTFDALIPVAEKMYSTYLGAKGKIKLNFLKSEDQKALNEGTKGSTLFAQVKDKDIEEYNKLKKQLDRAESCQKDVGTGLTIPGDCLASAQNPNSCGYSFSESAGILKKEKDMPGSSSLACCNVLNTIYQTAQNCSNKGDLGENGPVFESSKLSDFNSAKFQSISNTITATITTNTNLKNAKAQVARNNANANVQVKEYEDICAMVPTTVEMVGSTIEQVKQIMAQTTATADADNGPEYIQRSSLLAMKEAHKGKKESADIKQTGWSIAAACYALYVGEDINNGAGIADISLPLRAGAAQFLSTFYELKARRHLKEMELLDKYLAQLPSIGFCNPYKQRTCYCAEDGNKGSSDFAQYCITSEYQDRYNIATNQTPMACVNQDGKIDSKCLCQKTNTCLPQTFSSNPNSLNLGISFANLGKPLEAVYGGNYNSGGLKSATNDTRAFTQRTLSQAQSKIKTNVGPLSPEQQSMADKLLESGIPANIAGTLASGQTTPEGRAAMAHSGVNPDQGKSLAGGQASPSSSSGSSAIKIVTYGEANEKTPVQKPSTNNSFNPFALLGKKPESKGGGIQILDFSNRAIDRAPQIQQNSGVPLWSIISHRYRTSAWGRFDLEKELNAAPAMTNEVGTPTSGK